MEELGISPVPARVYVYLLFSEQPEATFEDLVSYFEVSKSAISNALKMLKSDEMIDFKTIGGKRKRYFYVDVEKTFNSRTMTSRYAKMMRLYDDIGKLRGKDDEFGKELVHAALFFKMLLIEMPIVVERWKRMPRTE